MPELTRADIEALVPHAGSMCLLDGVTAWDAASIHCHSDSHRQRDGHPLWQNGGIAPVHLIEYAAQAAAVHGGLLATQSGVEVVQAGFLAGVREVTLPEQPIDTLAATLDIRAFREMGDAQGMIYRFVVENAGMALSNGRLTIMDAG